MKRSDIFKVVIIALALVACVWYLVPTIRFMAMSPEAKASMDPYKLDRLKDKIIKLGLDLQGGMHLVLEVDKSKLTEDEAKDAVDRAIEIIRNRVDQYGVSEPLIQKQGDSRIIVELPGLQDKLRAKELIGKTALLEFIMLEDQEFLRETIDKVDAYLARGAGGGADSVAADTAAPAQTAAVAAKADTVKKDSLEDLSAMFGQEEKRDTAAAGKAAAAAVGKPFSSLLVSLGGDVAVSEEHVLRVKRLLADTAVQKLVAGQLLWSGDATDYNNKRYHSLYLLKKEAELTGVYITEARVQIGSGSDLETANQPYVSLTLNDEGGEIFDRVTGANLNKRMAIVMDKKVHSAPTIRSRIPNGQAQITGRFSMTEAQDLSIILRSGSLPAPVNIIEERSVGPSLGKDSIRAGLSAGLLGTLVVLLFMMVYYRMSGILANVALVLNLFFLLAAMAGLNATLTLPGIAGIILTIGMAIDANVLILERIREELALGKTIRSAIESGYEKAFTTILDSNMTTIITGVVLYQFGSGPIRGFAITLIVGLLINMFTAILVTRVIYDYITTKYPIKQLSI
jgi:protein-export membrane protein SecD